MFELKKDFAVLDFPQLCEYEETKHLYKIYNDGSHYVGTRVEPKQEKSVIRLKSEKREYFNQQYDIAKKQGVKQKDMFLTMKNAMLEKYSDFKNVNDFVDVNIKRKKHNFYSCLKRFKRKANLNIWNKFVTITYDDEKLNAETFKRKLRKCLSNLHTRRGWKYMGVFELGEDNKRLHFHAIMYIPKNQMVGEISEIKEWSTKKHKMITIHSNSFFAKTFGRNDFEDLSKAEILIGNTLDYLTKYLHKTNEKIFYSRGIPTEIYKVLDINEDVAGLMFDYTLKFVFFDNTFNLKNDNFIFETG